MDVKRQKERISAYSNIAQVYSKYFINELDNKPLDRKIYDLFFDRVQSNGTTLEIGCGPGEISSYLWNKGLKITGIDLSEKMVHEAKRYNPSIPFIVGNVFDLSYKTNTIAGIVAPYLIVNFSKNEVLEAFREINRVLKPEGCFLLSFHIGRDNQRLYRDIMVKGTKLTFTFFRVETIKKLLTKAGFHISEVIIKEPYQGEITKRSYIFSKK